MFSLKFKAIDKSTGEEYAMCDVAIRKDLGIRFSPEGDMLSNNPNIIFSQYTGKNDVNGKEIYRDDVVAVGPLRCVLSDTYNYQKIMSLKNAIYGEHVCNFYDSNIPYIVLGNRYESLDTIEARHKEVLVVKR